MTVMPKKGRFNIWLLSPLIVLPIAVIAATPALKTSVGGPASSVIGAAAAIFVMGYALYLSIRFQRCVDEVQAAGAAFAQKWGTAAGSIGFVLLMMLPPFWDVLAGAIRDAADDAAASQRIIKLAVLSGFGGTVILQTLGLFVANAIWWRGKR